MAYKIKVSKSSYNVLTETNPNNLIFDSAKNTFKIIASGSLINQTVNANPKTFTFTHSQSSIPAVYAFAKFPDGYVALPNETNYDFNTYTWWKVTVDSTNVNFIFYKNGGNYNVNIKYYIFEAPGT